MKSKTEITRQDIERAFDLFDKNRMPEGYGPSKRWDVLNPKNDGLYPRSAIWAIASKNKKPYKGYRQAKSGFEKLGYKIVEKRKIKAVDSIHNDFQKEVEQSPKDAPAKRRARLAKAPRKPQEKLVQVRDFIRNRDVVVEVLKRSKGRCENKECTKPEPFRKSNGKTYLEVHHKEQLAKGGDDTVENAVALCPNCHRQAHYGPSITRYL